MYSIFNNISDKGKLPENLYSLRVLKTPRLSTVLARVLVVMGTIFFISLFMPWQQNIRGTGHVTALDPSLRPQTVQSIIPGMIKKWHIREGQFINLGDTIIELSEMKDKYFDPDLPLRLEEQIEAKTSGLLAKELKKKAYQNQIKALKEGLKLKLKQARNTIDKTLLELESDSMAYEAEKINFKNSENIFKRNKARYDSGNISLTKFQELETKYNMARSKLTEQENKYLQSRAQLSIVTTDLSGIQADYSEKISKATTELQATLSEINDARGEISKLRNNYSNVRIRRNQYYLTAPQSGYVVRTLKAGIGESVKEGEAIVTIQPQNPKLAVEMHVRAMDVPLIEPGRKVRIQFDGWPALQFSGWPNVSVGTFGGKVKVIDRANNKDGLFRILIVEDPDDESWPKQLRIGSGTRGWVMLDNVRIWYEIWRQLNGFPPSLYNSPDPADTKGKSSNSKTSIL